MIGSPQQRQNCPLCLLQKDFTVLTDNPTVSAILENDIPFERNVSTVDFCASVIETTSYFTYDGNMAFEYRKTKNPHEI